MLKKIIIILILLILPITSAQLEGFGNQLPTIEAIGDQYLIVGQPYSFKVNAVDADKDILTFSDSTELFNIDSSTGEINFVPKEEDVGKHVVTISVSDGTETSATTVYFTVTEKKIAGRFELDKSIIKVLASYGESEEAQLTIHNLGSEATYILELQGLENRAYLSAEQIQISAKSSETIDINFGKVIPGIYTGKLVVRSGDQTETIPIVFEVESSEVQVDGKLSLQADEFRAGDEIIFSITLIDLSASGVKEVRVYRYTYDLLGNEIQKTYEDLNIETQATFTKTLKLPSYLMAGEYITAIKIVSGNSIGTSSQVFSITGEPAKLGIPVIIYPILAVIIFAAFLLVYKNRRELLHVKKLEKKKISLKNIERLERKKAKYISQLRTLSEAFELKTISKNSYNIAKKRIEAEIKKINRAIKRKESKI